MDLASCSVLPPGQRGLRRGQATCNALQWSLRLIQDEQAGMEKEQTATPAGQTAWFSGVVSLSSLPAPGFWLCGSCLSSEWQRPSGRLSATGEPSAEPPKAPGLLGTVLVGTLRMVPRFILRNIPAQVVHYLFVLSKTTWQVPVSSRRIRSPSLRRDTAAPPSAWPSRRPRLDPGSHSQPCSSLAAPLEGKSLGSPLPRFSHL